MKQHRSSIFPSLKILTTAAMLTAVSVVIGAFCKNFLNFGNGLFRITFENLPVILAGIVLGPLAGAMTGAVADLVGCLAYGYSINPLITLGAAAVGLVSGSASLLLRKSPLLLRISLSAVLAHLVGSVLIKTAGLAAWYLASYEIGYAELVLWRLLNYTIIAVLEITLLYILLRHRGVARQLERMCKK